MNAIQFIQQRGIEKAREVVSGAPDGANGFRVLNNSKGYGYAKVSRHGVYWDKCGKWESITITEQQTVESFKATLIDLSELKRVVESVDLIEVIGGIEVARRKVKMADFNGFLLISFQAKNGLASVYIQKAQQAIADYESIGGEHV